MSTLRNSIILPVFLVASCGGSSNSNEQPSDTIYQYAGNWVSNCIPLEEASFYSPLTTGELSDSVGDTLIEVYLVQNLDISETKIIIDDDLFDGSDCKTPAHDAESIITTLSTPAEGLFSEGVFDSEELTFNLDIHTLDEIVTESDQPAIIIRTGLHTLKLSKFDNTLYKVEESSSNAQSDTETSYEVNFNWFYTSSVDVY